MPNYPGLGLSVRYDHTCDFGHYPIGAHESCLGSESDMLLIRELAMMSIMDRLSDKEDWHKKVFDEDIISRWRAEALAISDAEFRRMATRDKRQRFDAAGNVELVEDDYGAEYVKPLEGIVDANTFDCVCCSVVLFAVGDTEFGL